MYQYLLGIMRYLTEGAPQAVSKSAKVSKAISVSKEALKKKTSSIAENLKKLKFSKEQVGRLFESVDGFFGCVRGCQKAAFGTIEVLLEAGWESAEGVISGVGRVLGSATNAGLRGDLVGEAVKGGAKTRQEFRAFVPKAAKGIEGKDYYREVELVTPNGAVLGEIDEIDVPGRVLFEDKSGHGLVGKSRAEVDEWVEDQIYEKITKQRDALVNRAETATRPTTSGTQSVPNIDDFWDFDFVIRFEADTPELRASMAEAIKKLQAESVGYQFGAVYGVK